MASRRSDERNSTPQRPRASTLQGREDQLINKAVDLAEKQLDDGTASAQVISHYLKLGSSREKLEQERLSKEVELLQIKKEAYASAARMEELMSEALNAFRSYAGQNTVELQPGVDYDYEE